MLNIHYALQTCDVKSFQNQKRFCSDSRTEISKKCSKSFFQSVWNLAKERPTETNHHIMVIEDHCTEELCAFLQQCQKEFELPNLKIEISHLTDQTGIADSIEACYKWLVENGKDLVYQVQDDYLFFPEAVTECVDIFNKIKTETNSAAIISPWNDCWLWQVSYRNKSTPRAVFTGRKGYWIQYYDMSCSFLTGHKQFIDNYDLMQKFLNIIRFADGKVPKELENISLNHLLTKRGILGIVPINCLALHMQSEGEKDPYIDWKPLWESIKI